MIPKGMGFVKIKDAERPECLNFKSFYIRKEQAKSIAAGLTTAQYIKTIKFRNCGLTDEILETLLQNVHTASLNNIDLSYNQMLT